MLLPVIGTHSKEVNGVSMAARIGPAAVAPSSSAWPLANLALFVPFTLNAPYPVRKLWWANGATANGNVDCGLYTPGGAQIVSAGSTVQAGTNTIQSVTLATPRTLAPGSYVMALAASATTVTVFAWVSSLSAGVYKLSGWAEATASFALPDPAAPQTYASRNFVPLFGFASAGVL